MGVCWELCRSAHWCTIDRAAVCELLLFAIHSAQLPSLTSTQLPPPSSSTAAGATSHFTHSQHIVSSHSLSLTPLLCSRHHLCVRSASVSASVSSACLPLLRRRVLLCAAHFCSVETVNLRSHFIRPALLSTRCIGLAPPLPPHCPLRLPRLSPSAARFTVRVCPLLSSSPRWEVWAAVAVLPAAARGSIRVRCQWVRT